MTPTISITKGQTAPLLLASIAIEELALGHMINAQAEAIQSFLGTLEGGIAVSPSFITLSDFLDLNSSVEENFRDNIMKEMLLEFKFRNILKLNTLSTTPASDFRITNFGGLSVICAGDATAINGRVIDFNGQPISNASVNFALSDPTLGSLTTNPQTTDANGFFSTTFTSNGAIGTVTITASAAGTNATATTSLTILTCAATPCSIVNNSPGHTICIGSSVTIEGTVVDCSGSPVANATIEFGIDDPFLGTLSSFTTTTDVSGHFSTTFQSTDGSGTAQVIGGVNGTTAISQWFITILPCP